jgi:hypothetical protein
VALSQFLINVLGARVVTVSLDRIEDGDAGAGGLQTGSPESFSVF